MAVEVGVHLGARSCHAGHRGKLCATKPARASMDLYRKIRQRINSTHTGQMAMICSLAGLRGFWFGMTMDATVVSLESSCRRERLLAEIAPARHDMSKAERK